FCEFAVFEPEQLADIPFTAGRIVWKVAGVSDAICQPQKASAPAALKSADFLLGEALTNLYVGLGREQRGEKLSAMRFIQGYAVDRLVELSAFIETAVPGYPDPFDIARRYEARYPSLASHLPQFLQGYERNCQSALAILNFLDNHFEINQPLKEAIIALANLSDRPQIKAH
ncbi:MAG: hypothetical protein WAM60_06040, partial [Candidatus Promineifilaceae bacterium]